MTLLGVGEILGGNIIGIFRDKYGNRAAYTFEIVLLLAGVGCVLVFNNQNKFGWMAYVMNFVWGLQDSGLNSLLRCLLGFEYEDKTTPFSVFNFVQSLSLFGVQLIGSQVMNSDFDTTKAIKYLNIYIIAAGTLGALSLLMMLFFKFKQDLKEEKKVEEEA
jgi:MFS family permease